MQSERHLAATVNLLSEQSPDVPENPVEDDMRPWRDRIDAIDRAVVEMLNQRAVCAITIGAIKKKIGVPVYAPAREEEVIVNVTDSNPGPLSDAAIKRLYERIIDETRSLERHLYQAHQDAKPEQAGPTAKHGNK